MSNDFIRVEVADHWLWTEQPDLPKTETGCKFNKPTLKRRYIKILAICLSYAPASIIYPNVKNPMMEQVRDMCRAGLLNRYKRVGDRKFYYKTTIKGQSLLIKAISEA